MTDRELGRRIGYWRRRRNLTQAVFADRIGKSKSWVEKVETGKRSAGRLSVLNEVCDVLQIDLSALLGEEPHRRTQGCLDDTEVGRIRSALERYDFDARAGASRTWPCCDGGWLMRGRRSSSLTTR